MSRSLPEGGQDLVSRNDSASSGVTTLDRMGGGNKSPSSSGSRSNRINRVNRQAINAEKQIQDVWGKVFVVDFVIQIQQYQQQSGVDGSFDSNLSSSLSNISLDQPLKMEVAADEPIYLMKDNLWSHPLLPQSISSRPSEQFVLKFINADQQMVELYDENQIFHSISVIKYWLMTGQQFTFYVFPQKRLSKRQQLMSKKIGNILNFGLYRFDYLQDDETDIFRHQMVGVRQQIIEQRDLKSFMYGPEIVDSPGDDVDNVMLYDLTNYDKITFRLHVPHSDMRKTLTCSLDERPAQVIEKFAARYQKSLPQDFELNSYCLKVSGRADFLMGEHRMIDYMHIRKCYMKQEKIELCLAKVEDLSQSSNDPIEEFDLIEDSTANIGSHAQLCLERQSKLTEDGQNSMQIMSLWDVARNFRIHLAACENLSCDQADTLYIEAGIYHGGVLMSPTLKTHQVIASKNPRFGAWLSFDITCYNLPRAARLCLTVYGRMKTSKQKKQQQQQSQSQSDLDGDEDATPLASVNFLLMDHKGFLQSGMQKISMWKSERANPFGTCVNNNLGASADDPSIFLRMDSFPCAVVYPQEKYEFDYNLKALEIDLLPNFVVDQLWKIIRYDPLTPLSVNDKALLWTNRYYCISIPEALPKIILSARWNYQDDCVEVKKLLKVWAPVSPVSALEMLDCYYGDSDVRSYAVSRLEELSDGQLQDYLMQLVQVLKYEPYLDCALFRFLLKRSLLNRAIGHFFYWHLRSEIENAKVTHKFALYAEAYLRGCGMFMDDLIQQSDVMTCLSDLSLCVRTVKSNSDRKEAFQRGLNNLRLPERFSLPIDPRLETTGLLNNKCKFMDSKKLPLWCVFTNVDQTGDDIYLICKSGDDLRQDMLTLQMIRIMEKLWQQDLLDLRMTPYRCLSTQISYDDPNKSAGLIEVVLNSDTVSNIQQQYGGSTAAFKDQPIDEWLRKNNPSQSDYEKAVQNFTFSCAGYCVATYVLGIGDRHNDNIMVSKDGHLFHIDFGHFLGNVKRKFGIKRERAPFVLTPDFVYVICSGSTMNGINSSSRSKVNTSHQSLASLASTSQATSASGGGSSSVGKLQDNHNFQQFVDICVKAYLIIRRNANLFINLFAMMLSTGIPELKSAEDISYLRDALCLDQSEEDAAKSFRNLIFESIRMGWSTQLNWWIHNLAHSKGQS
ncbi:hypothetical protein MIR68_004421 [Amoeboaphelidium protococcarum]|nr:hypothetical protein MIR68_004421 [Amoeboaphelidium protococcarum]